MNNDLMSNDLNERLRAALRPVDPGESFTQRVLTRVAAEPAPESAPASLRLVRTVGLRWLSAAALVTCLAAGLITYEWHTQRAREGLEARRQVMEALRVTSEKLDLAYRVVKRGA